MWFNTFQFAKPKLQQNGLIYNKKNVLSSPFLKKIKLLFV